jgi:beta-lactamase regulating signal transducer with metallopeptidase domain
VTVLTALLSITIYSVVIFAGIMLFRLILKKHVSPLLMYLVWFLLIARLMIPVTLDSGFSLITIPSEENSALPPYSTAGPVNETGSGNPNAYNTADKNSGLADTQNTVKQPGFVLNVPAVLIGVWAIGMALMLAQTLAASIKLKARLRRDSVPAPGEWAAIADRIRAELNVRSRIRIVMVKDFISPALNASIYPVIVMPEPMASEVAEKVEFALRHEITHLKRGDHLVCLLLAALRIVYWFNPVVWLASRQIKMDMETACDNAAVGPMGRERAERYAETVLDMYANGKVKFVLGMSLHSTKRTAERRVRGIFMRRRSSYTGRAAAALLAAVVLVACFTTACVPGPETSDTGSTPEITASAAPETESSAAQTAAPPASAAEAPAASPAVSPAAIPAANPSPTPTLAAAATPEPVAALPGGVTAEKKFMPDLDGDGIAETIAVCSVKNSYEIRIYVLYAGGYKKAVVDEGTFQGAYLAHTGDNQLCLLVSIDEASEDYVTTSFSFNGRTPVARDDASGYVYGLSETEVTLSGHIYIIGTWDYTCVFMLKNNFTLEKASDYTILENWMEPLHTIRDLPVEMRSGDAYVAGTLPAGTSLQPASTDTSTYMCFKLADGSAGRFFFTRGDDYEVYIAGVAESEYFDNIAYSD